MAIRKDSDSVAFGLKSQDFRSFTQHSWGEFGTNCCIYYLVIHTDPLSIMLDFFSVIFSMPKEFTVLQISFFKYFILIECFPTGKNERSFQQ